jgi:hypothetical protein
MGRSHVPIPFMWERRDEKTVKEAVNYAFRSVKLASMKRCFTDEERRIVTEAVVRHIDRCGWEVWHDVPPMHSCP